MSESTEEKVIFVVDTRNYSGNFEREMCAYVVGVIGECEVGCEEAELFAEEVDEVMADSIVSIVRQEHDDHGVYRPCAIWPTPGRVNNGFGRHYDAATYEGAKKYEAYESVAIFFSETPTPEMVELMKTRAKEFCDENKLDLHGFRLLKKVTKTITTEEELNV